MLIILKTSKLKKSFLQIHIQNAVTLEVDGVEIFNKYNNGFYL